MTEPTWTATRSQLMDALANIEVRGVQTSGPMAGKVIADDVADAILAQLPSAPASVTVDLEDLHAVLAAAESPVTFDAPTDEWPEAWDRLALAAGFPGLGCRRRIVSGAGRAGEMHGTMSDQAEATIRT